MGSISLGKDLSKSDIDKILQNFSNRIFKCKCKLNDNVLKTNLQKYPIINELVILLIKNLSIVMK